MEDVKVDTALSREALIKQFVKEIKTPYRSMVDDMIVNVVFTDNRNTLQDRLQQYLQLAMV